MSTLSKLVLLFLEAQDGQIFAFRALLEQDEAQLLSFLVGKLVWVPGKVESGVLGDVCVPNGSLIAVLLLKTAVLEPARG